MKKKNPNRVAYPIVIVDPSPPYCDCRQKEYEMYGGFCSGCCYCPEHNVIIMENLFMSKDPTVRFEETIEIIDHETMHWIFCKDFSKSISLKFDDILENEECEELISNKPENKPKKTLPERIRNETGSFLVCSVCNKPILLKNLSHIDGKLACKPCVEKYKSERRKTKENQQ